MRLEPIGSARFNRLQLLMSAGSGAPRLVQFLDPAVAYSFFGAKWYKIRRRSPLLRPWRIHQNANVRSIIFPAEMITTRFAFNLHYDRPHPVNQPLRNQYSPISRPSLRFRSQNAFPLRFRRIHIAYCTENSFDSTREDDLSSSEIIAPSGSDICDFSFFLLIAIWSRCWR